MLVGVRNDINNFSSIIQVNSDILKFYYFISIK